MNTSTNTVSVKINHLSLYGVTNKPTAPESEDDTGCSCEAAPLTGGGPLG